MTTGAGGAAGADRVRGPDTVARLAESALRQGQYNEALRHVATLPAGTLLPAELAWRLGRVLHQRGEFESAESLYERAAADAGYTGADQAQLLAGRSAARWARGDRTRARSLADEAVRAAERSRDDAALAAAYLAQALAAFSEGDRAANEHAYARAFAAAERAGDMGLQLRIRSNVGSRLVEEGRLREAVDALTEAIRLGEGAPQQTVLALALHNRAEAWLGLSDLNAARADADRALTLWQREGSPLAAFGLLMIARVHLTRGSAWQATATYREAVAMAEPDGNSQVVAQAWAGLARTCYADDPGEAARYAELSLTLPSAAGPVIGELAAGWVALCSGDTASAAQYAADVRAEAGRRRDPAGLAEAMELAALAAYRGDSAAMPGRPTARRAAGLVEAAAVWADTGNEVALATNALLRARHAGDRLSEDVAWQRLHRLGVCDDIWHIAGPLAAIGPPPVPEVAVQTLGHLAVLLSGTPVPPAGWQSRKARELVKVLAGQLGRPVTRTALAALLWPHTPSEVANRRLSVLISTVRAVLDPARRHPANRFLVTDPSSVRLNTEHVVLDTVRFYDAARAAIAANAALEGSRDTAAGVDMVARLEVVVGMYTGDFGDDGELTEEWIDRPRAAFAELHRDVVRTLARRCLRLDRCDAAAGWYLRLIGEDGYDESAHLELIAALSAAGRHGEARRRYRDYAKRMHEIDVRPVPFPTA